MKTASVAEVKERLSDVLRASKNSPVVITRKGRRVAVLIGMEDEDEIERLLMSYSPELQAILEKSRQQIRDGEYLTHEEFWAQFGLSPSARKKSRTRRKNGKTRLKRRGGTP